MAYGILVPRAGIEPTSFALQGGFLTTGPPRESLLVTFKYGALLFDFVYASQVNFAQGHIPSWWDLWFHFIAPVPRAHSSITHSLMTLPFTPSPILLSPTEDFFSQRQGVIPVPAGSWLLAPHPSSVENPEIRDSLDLEQCWHEWLLLLLPLNLQNSAVVSQITS